MSIILYLGNVGSGKTASAVREMMLNPKRVYYTNIQTKLKNCRILEPNLILNKEAIGKTDKFRYSVNLEYWEKLDEPISIVIDEVHNIFSARSSMSMKNRCFVNWLSMARRVLGQTTSGYGDLILISQASNMIDTIGRQLAHRVIYHVCNYRKTCGHCGLSWGENSAMPEIHHQCPKCGWYNIKMGDYSVQKWFFASTDDYLAWKQFGVKAFYRSCIVWDIEEAFSRYDSHQWGNLFDKY